AGGRRGLRERRRGGELRARLRGGLEQGDEPRPVRPGDHPRRGTPMSSATEARVGAPPREAAFSAAIRKYVVEAGGQFFLGLAVGAAVYAAAPLAPLAIGAVLMVMIYAGGHISGGHYNPAVTLAVLVRGKIGAIDAVLYWVAQIAAGLVAALVVRG